MHRRSRITRRAVAAAALAFVPGLVALEPATAATPPAVVTRVNGPLSLTGTINTAAPCSSIPGGTRFAFDGTVATVDHLHLAGCVGHTTRGQVILTATTTVTVPSGAKVLGSIPQTTMLPQEFFVTIKANGGWSDGTASAGWIELDGANDWTRPTMQTAGSSIGAVGPATGVAVRTVAGTITAASVTTVHDGTCASMSRGTATGAITQPSRPAWKWSVTGCDATTTSPPTRTITGRLQIATPNGITMTGTGKFGDGLVSRSQFLFFVDVQITGASSTYLAGHLTASSSAPAQPRVERAPLNGTLAVTLP